MIYIYGLVDPLVHQIAYVGKTNDLYGRWESHVKTEAQHITGQWIQRLRAAGIEPTLVALETLPDDGDWMNAERWWISHGLRIGWPLTNTVYAGDRAESNGNAFAESISVWSNEISPQLLKRPRQKTSNYIRGERIRHNESFADVGMPRLQELISEYVVKYDEIPSQRQVQYAYKSEFGKMFPWHLIKKAIEIQMQEGRRNE